MKTPSWRQLAAIPHSLLKERILRALAIEPPPEGIADTFYDQGLYVCRCADGQWIVLPDSAAHIGSAFYPDGSAALRAAGRPAGTPTGDALRRWMRSRGWKPASERAQVEPTENTRTIV